MYRVYLGLGSNEGDRLGYLSAAISAINGIAPVVSVSSIYETEPMNMPGAEMFLNMAIGIETDLTPIPLIHALKHIEMFLGRKPFTHLKPRAIDIDILLYDELSYLDSEIRVPHRSMHTRRFVLAPLCDIAPQARHPVLLRTVRELLSECLDTAEVFKTSLTLPLPYRIQQPDSK